MSNQAIGDHALLSDCQTAALVDLKGSVEWWCTPRFDSPSVFARILDDEAGHFAITPRNITAAERSYVDGSLVLRTVFQTDDGSVELTDALVVGEGERGHELGTASPHVLVRSVKALSGNVVLDVSFVPGFEFGLTSPMVYPIEGGVVSRAGPVTLTLATDVNLTVEGHRARASVELSAGESLELAAQTTSSWDDPEPLPWTGEMVSRRLEDTVSAWRSWSEAHQSYKGPYAEAVAHSGRVLQGLTYVPTGAIVAAPTTSLPEHVGGERNWDYRYCWVRDAGFTLRALWVAACPDESESFLRYITTAATSVYEKGQLQIMFGIDGRRDLTERELPWLDGWRGSSPVRVGNGAWNQPQHDVYGELLSSVHRLRHQFGAIDERESRLLAFLADRAARVWKQPDHGIWEFRGDPEHFLHSKLMCWVALDRAIEMADLLGAVERVDSWRESRTEIREEIVARGWSEEVGSFTQVLGGVDLDASALLIPIVGFLPFDDQRIESTIDTIRERLADKRGLLRRYSRDDGLDGAEGSFLLCTFWLAEALAGAGRPTEARETFELAAGYCNDVGLLSEEVDPVSDEMIGNFPQAFSHIGLVNAAWAIAQAEG